MRRRRAVLVVAGMLLWLPNIFIEPTSPLIRTFGLTATLLGSASFLVAAYQTHAEDLGRSGAIFEPLVSLVAWVGVYSYAIYIWHVTALGILQRECGELLSAWMDIRMPSGWLVAVVVVSAGAIFVGVAASKLVEWPVLRFRDRFFPTRSVALPTPAAATKTPGNAELPLSAPSVRPIASSTECV
jgi:peptidoglycan/LPS O-acetylase OafA/YrhL